MFFTIELF